VSSRRGCGVQEKINLEPAKLNDTHTGLTFAGNWIRTLGNATYFIADLCCCTLSPANGWLVKMEDNEISRNAAAAFYVRFGALRRTKGDYRILSFLAMV